MPVSPDKEFLKAFGDHLYKVRIRKGISRVQLAFELNTNEKYLRLVENGEISTGLGNLYKISQALDIRLSDLFDFDY